MLLGLDSILKQVPESIPAFLAFHKGPCSAAWLDAVLVKLSDNYRVKRGVPIMCATLHHRREVTAKAAKSKFHASGH